MTAGNGQTVCIRNHGGSIDTATWQPGLYIVTVDTDKDHYRTKTIKE